MNKLPSYEQALDAALSVVTKVSSYEMLPTDSGVGRLLAIDIVADRDLPAYNRSQMDGYAVVAGEVSDGCSMKVVGQIPAGTLFKGERSSNTCVEIATGAPVPDCFDAVVQHELTDNGTDVVIFHCGDVSTGKSIHPKGVDAKAGDVLVAMHTIIAPQHLGIAASVGVHEIKVVSKPRIVILTSGDEVVGTQQQPLPHQIRNGNSPMIAAAFISMGCDVLESKHIHDDPEVTNKAIEEALNGCCDLVVTVGGISAGKRDFFPTAFGSSGVELAVKGANIQPGKPVIVGNHEHTVVLGLPGNPVSALVCSTVFGWPIVRGLQGISTLLPWQESPLAASVTPNPKRLSFRPCKLVDGRVAVPPWQGSGDLSHTSTTQGLAQLPSSNTEIQAGSQVTCLAWPWI